MKENIHNSFNFLIKLGNCLGILPVSGLKSPIDLFYDWKSWKCIFSYMMMAIFAVNTIFCLIHWTLVRFTFAHLATQMYHINAMTVLILYQRLARKWPKFIRNWYEVDNTMLKEYGYPRGLTKRIRIFTSFILVATIGEYVLSIIYDITKVSLINHGKVTAKLYYEHAFPEFFYVIPLNGFMAAIASITSLTGNLIWAFNDLFVISISSALALRFKQITDRLALTRKQKNSNEYWAEVRRDYDRLVHLARKVDKYISYVVLLSFSANIFFLLIQLSNTVGNMTYNMEIVYYLFIFTSLIARLTAVSLYGAWVNDESKEPANWLNSVPSGSYNLEIRRLLLQISFNDVAITGSRMFRVTRGLILSVAGAIVTYELVVIQFSNTMQTE